MRLRFSVTDMIRRISSLRLSERMRGNRRASLFSEAGNGSHGPAEGVRPVRTDRTLAVCAAPLRAGMIACCLLATSAVPSQQAFAQQRISPDSAMSAFSVVDDAIRRDEAAGLDAGVYPACVAAAVTIRFQNEVAGYGTDFTVEPGGSGSAIPNAAKAALERAKLSLPALDREEFLVISRDFTISLEVVEELTPLASDGSWGDLQSDVNPGSDAFAIRSGTKFAVRFPEWLLARKLEPLATFQGMVSELLGAEGVVETKGQEVRFRDPAELAERFGVVFYRARTTHIVGFPTYLTAAPTFGQLAQGARFLTRGGLLEPIPNIPGGVAEFADAVARHLQERAWTGAGPVRLVGSIQPNGSAIPTIAPPTEQAAAAYALAVYSKSPGVDPHTAGTSRALAMDLLEALETPAADESASWDDPAASALCVLAICELSDAAPGEAVRYAKLRASCSATLRGAYSETAGFAPGVPGTAKGLIAYSLARLGVLASSDTIGAQAAAAVRTAFQQTPPELLIGQMPWLLWGESATRAEGGAAFVVPLRELRTLLRAHQVSSDQAGPDRQDLVGGFVFTTTGVPMPTWHTARATATLAGMLSDASLTSTEPAELAREFTALRRSLRFMRQLGVDASDTYLYRTPQATLGGVRAAPWNIELPLDASTMTLLALCESLRAVDALNR